MANLSHSPGRAGRGRGGGGDQQPSYQSRDVMGQIIPLTIATRSNTESKALPFSGLWYLYVQLFYIAVGSIGCALVVVMDVRSVLEQN